MKKFEQLQQIYNDNLANSVIPFWVKNSPDWDNGGTFSSLDYDGSVYDTKKYVWLLGRSAWMFCRLYNVFKKDPQYLKIAELGLKFIENYAIDPKGRYYFSLTAEGKPYFYQRKPYGAVFCMLAYLEYFNASGKDEYLEKATKLFWQIDKWIANPSLMDRLVLAGSPKISALGDVMVMASMAIELQAVDPKQQYLDVMAKALGGIDLHRHGELGILLENVSLDGSDLSELPEGRFFNPGHSLEVAWFLLHLLEFLPDKAKEKMALDIIEASIDFGWDREFGGIYYFMDIAAKPTLQLESSMKLWWPHTEAIYALALAYKKTSDEAWLKRLNLLHDYSFERFVDTENGEWFGYCDRRGNLTHRSKGGNYKGFFHVPRALLMSSRL